MCLIHVYIFKTEILVHASGLEAKQDALVYRGMCMAAIDVWLPIGAFLH